MLKKLRKREEGQGLVEYALILVMVAIIVLAVLLLLGPQVGGVFSNVVANLQRVGVGGYTLTFSSGPGITKGPGTLNCNYAVSGSVQATKASQPAPAGVGVSGNVDVYNSGGAYQFSFGISGTTDGSGSATLSGSTSAACSGASATVTITGGPSANVSF